MLSLTSPRITNFFAPLVLYELFYRLSGIPVMIARGNHDAHLEAMLSGFMNVEIGKEILIGEYAFMHGNSLPSADALKRGYIVVGHGHSAANVNGVDVKAWVIARPGSSMKKKYKAYNKKIRLVVVPAFNRMIVGTRIGNSSNLPLFRSGVFDI